MLNFFTQLPVAVQAAGLLVLSNCFMTFAWYGHLKYLSGSAWYVAAVVSWSIALFEYLLQVPANRIGFSELSLAQLKIMQEVITLSVFVPFSIVYMKEGFKLDYIWAALCLTGAVYFMFRH
mgnify:CR=1 FL=1